MLTVNKFLGVVFICTWVVVFLLLPATSSSYRGSTGNMTPEASFTTGDEGAEVQVLKYDSPRVVCIYSLIKTVTTTINDAGTSTTTSNNVVTSCYPNPPSKW